MTSSLAPLAATGRRVWVHTAQEGDLPAYQVAVQQSAARIGRWNPVNPADLHWHLERQTEDHRTFLIHAMEAEGSHGIVGKVNVTNVVRGRFQNGVIGYDSYDPYVGRGLFAEGLRLIIDIAFAQAPRGMGLHRIEANVRPGNSPSSGVLRSIGFRREGYVQQMLWLPGPDGSHWRDHLPHAITREEWPAAPYAPHRWPRIALLVKDSPGLHLGSRLAHELGLPLFSSALLDRDLGPGPATDQALWSLLAASPVGGVVEEPNPQPDSVFAGLQRAGFDPTGVPQVGCALGFGFPLELDPRQPVDDRVVVRLALRARSAFA
ncbi:GNAT family N-acetyltransferase [Flexivirga meconopsidis]|uniref:GNAT family N-acetyltransferase n=1 Tax=Flexivirga meconopsidis TaxID=2977121 RepID=UPI00223F80B0